VKNKKMVWIIVIMVLIASLLVTAVSADIFTDVMDRLEDFAGGGALFYEKAIGFVLIFVLILSAALIGLRRAFGEKNRPITAFAISFALLSSITIVITTDFTFEKFGIFGLGLLFVIFVGVLYAILRKLGFEKHKFWAFFIALVFSLLLLWLVLSLFGFETFGLDFEGRGGTGSGGGTGGGFFDIFKGAGDRVKSTFSRKKKKAEPEIEAELTDIQKCKAAMQFNAKKFLSDYASKGKEYLGVVAPSKETDSILLEKRVKVCVNAYRSTIDATTLPEGDPGIKVLMKKAKGQYYIYFAESYEEMGASGIDPAIEAYLKVLIRDPKFGIEGSTTALEKQALDAVERLLKEGTGNIEKRIDFYLRLGDYYLRIREFDKAKEMFLKAYDNCNILLKSPPPAFDEKKIIEIKWKKVAALRGILKAIEGKHPGTSPEDLYKTNTDKYKDYKDELDALLEELEVSPPAGPTPPVPPGPITTDLYEIDSDEVEVGKSVKLTIKEPYKTANDWTIAIAITKTSGGGGVTISPGGSADEYNIKAESDGEVNIKVTATKPGQPTKEGEFTLTIKPKSDTGGMLDKIGNKWIYILIPLLLVLGGGAGIGIRGRLKGGGFWWGIRHPVKAVKGLKRVVGKEQDAKDILIEYLTRAENKFRESRGVVPNTLRNEIMFILKNSLMLADKILKNLEANEKAITKLIERLKNKKIVKRKIGKQTKWDSIEEWERNKMKEIDDWEGTQKLNKDSIEEVKALEEMCKMLHDKIFNRLDDLEERS